MVVRIETFPFTELADEEMLDMTELQAVLLLRTATLEGENAQRDGAVIKHIVADGVFAADLRAVLFGLARDCIEAWQLGGFPASSAIRSPLGADLLSVAIYWCGVVTRRAFAAGMAHRKHSDALEEFGQRWSAAAVTGEGDDVG